MEISCRTYRPRRPRDSPLFRLVERHLEELLRVWPERFARQHGPLRAVVERVLREFLRCGLLEHGFARLWCGECRRSVLVAFSCRGRSFCPSCEKKQADPVGRMAVQGGAGAPRPSPCRAEAPIGYRSVCVGRQDPRSRAPGSREAYPGRESEGALRPAGTEVAHGVWEARGDHGGRLGRGGGGVGPAGGDGVHVPGAAQGRRRARARDLRPAVHPLQRPERSGARLARCS